METQSKFYTPFYRRSNGELHFFPIFQDLARIHLEAFCKDRLRAFQLLFELEARASEIQSDKPFLLRVELDSSTKSIKDCIVEPRDVIIFRAKKDEENLKITFDENEWQAVVKKVGYTPDDRERIAENIRERVQREDEDDFACVFFVDDEGNYFIGEVPASDFY